MLSDVIIALWSTFQKMASKTADIRKVDVAKMMLGRLVSDIVTFDPDMIPLRRKVIHKWGAAPFTNPVSELWYHTWTKVTGGVPKIAKSIVLPAIIGFLTNYAMEKKSRPRR